MDNLALIGMLLAPFLIAALIYREEMILYFLILDSWIILRISQMVFFHPALSLNRLLTVFAFLVVVTKFWIKGKSIVPRSGLNILGVLVVVFLIYLAYSYYSYTGKIEFNLVNNIVFFYLCVLLLQDDYLRKFNIIAMIVVIIVAILSISSLFNIVSLGDVGQRSIAGNRNHTAFYILEGVTLMFALGYTRVNSRFIRIIINIVIACGLVAIVLSLGRTITTIALASMLFYIYKGYIKKKTALVACVLVIFVALFQFDKVVSFKDKLFRVPDGGNNSVLSLDEKDLGAFTSGRSGAYEIAWDLYLDNPITGIGYDRWAGNVTKGQHGSSLHSRWLQILVETGPFGAILYLALYLFSIIYLYRISRRPGYAASREKHIARAILVGLSGFFLMGITDNHGYTDRIFYLFLAMTAVMYSNNRKGYKTDVEGGGDDSPALPGK
ncbi:hypothetical protein MNBD_GAMMA15-2111 [hydrothermal vent metagenome]|uniref:O-antigen ligase-related domain-containing protein n=1 Tax=hydrothermal vent metagenome TaxID=652676 RepID=A0A3B0Z5R9_9ZZZZ